MQVFLEHLGDTFQEIKGQNSHLQRGDAGDEVLAPLLGRAVLGRGSARSKMCRARSDSPCPLTSPWRIGIGKIDRTRLGS